MLIYNKISDLHNYLTGIRAKHLSIGFVPTMGALHEGHISLIKASIEQCKVTICSIFVNPRQFNDQNDLKRYPRMPEKDADLLKKAGCTVLFLPSVEEIYPNENKQEFDFGHLDQILEAQFRPGHFNGVAEVLKRFFEIIQPDKAFFGIKDYQQVMIVKALIKMLHSPIQIVPGTILREKDGLAMSSRNALLSEEERKIAALIPKLMHEAIRIIPREGISQAKEFVQTETAKIPLMKMEYFEVCDAETLIPVSKLGPDQRLVSLIAVYVGKIRLIDNLLVNS